MLIATITNTQLDSTKGEPEVTLAVTKNLRGSELPGTNIEVPIDWTLGPKVLPAMRMPVWHNVLPVVGKQVLLMGWKGGEQLRARCVLDWSGTDAASKARITGVIQRMMDLDDLPAGEKTKAMETALSDREIAIRSLAENYLTSPRVRDPQVRSYILQHCAPIAMDPQNSQRREALSTIKLAYDGFSPDSDVNYQILSFVADRMADSDPEVRSTAVQFLYSKFFSQTKNKPDVSRIRITDRKGLSQQLEQDANGRQDFSPQAKHVLELFKDK